MPEVPLKGNNKTLVKILGGRQHRTTPAGQILGVATPATPAALTPIVIFNAFVSAACAHCRHGAESICASAGTSHGPVSVCLSVCHKSAE